MKRSTFRREIVRNLASAATSEGEESLDQSPLRGREREQVGDTTMSPGGCREARNNGGV